MKTVLTLLMDTAGVFEGSRTAAANLAGQSLTSAPDDRDVVLLISDGVLSDPEEIVQAVLAKRFDEGVVRAAVPLTAEADHLSVLRMFAKGNVFDPTLFADPRPLLSFFDESVLSAPVVIPAADAVTLFCTIDLGEGNSFTLSVSAPDAAATGQKMRDSLAEFGHGDAAVRETIAAYIKRVL